MTQPAEIGEQLVRREYGRLVAVLSRRIGLAHLALVEDAVQAALLAALETWGKSTAPENPSAWLYRVAYRHAIDELRGRTRRERILATIAEAEVGDECNTQRSSSEVGDDLLRMLFACCDASLPVESQLVIALKVLCGFDVREIAQRLFTTEANVYKRLGRGRARLRDLPLDLEQSTEPLAERLVGVQAVLYLLFNEGYLSQSDPAIRRELCHEAMRLALLLAEHPACRTPETCALLALMHLHAARLDARQDAAGALLLLEEQDRSRWDDHLLRRGLEWLARSASGDVFSRYHAEAGIAAEHCLAPSFAATRWARIAECYALLERFEPSALHRLNRALAVAEWQGPAQGLAVLEGHAPPSWLEGSYLWAAVSADLHARCGHDEIARRYRATALALAPSATIGQALERRMRSVNALR